MNIHSTARSVRSGGLAAAMLFAAIVAGAAEVQVKLSGDAEVPPVSTQASGSGSITVNPDMTVSGSVMTSGVAATMAHIHAGKTGENGGVIVTLVKEGENGWAVPAGTKLTAAQFQAYQAGGLYVNVHSEAHKGGEIRGQLMPPMMPSAPARTGMPGGY